MFAIEFHTKVKDGTIEIPSEYRESFKDQVRVIVLADQPVEKGNSFIDELLLKPIRLNKFRPFARDEIYG